MSLKKLPNGTTKQELVNMYIDQLPEHEIRYEINLIFEKNNRSKNKKTIPHLLFMDFVKKYGVPRNYEE